MIWPNKRPESIQAHLRRPACPTAQSCAIGWPAENNNRSPAIARYRTDGNGDLPSPAAGLRHALPRHGRRVRSFGRQPRARGAWGQHKLLFGRTFAEPAWIKADGCPTEPTITHEPGQGEGRHERHTARRTDRARMARGCAPRNRWRWTHLAGSRTRASPGSAQLPRTSRRTI